MTEQAHKHNILLPLDGTNESRAALGAARRAAETMDAVLHILHVSSKPMTVEEVVGKLGLSAEESMGVVFQQATGDPVTEILRVAASIDAVLIVMSTHGKTQSSDPETTAIGSVAEEIVQAANCPIITVRPENLKPDTQMGRLRRILVPLDGTPTTAAAVKPAAEIALRRDAELLILHIATSGNKLPNESGGLMVGPYMDQPQHEWPLWAGEFLDRFTMAQSELITQLRLRLHLVYGEPALEIVHFAAEHRVDLIVTAWHGRFSKDHAPVIKHLLHEAPCPIYIVQDREAANANQAA